MHGELAALGVFFDPLAVAAALRDAAGAGAPEAAADEARPAIGSSGPAAVHDHGVLVRLLPQELYGLWRDSGYAGIYCMTFLLRHAVTVLALLAHEKACPGPLDACSGPASFLKKHFPDRYGPSASDCLEPLCCSPPRARNGRGAYVPVIGFSSLGFHVLYREPGLCRAFDFYSIASCARRADGLFCPEHRAEAWWCDCGHAPSTQAEMFRFYGDRENLHRYDEQQLQELVGRFWTHFKRTRHLPKQGAGGVEEALGFFTYASLHECCAGGLVHLRRRYTERARALHPDAGGEHAQFVLLQKHYEVLRACIQYERAGFP